jgi:hypothetical protein
LSVSVASTKDWATASIQLLLVYLSHFIIIESMNPFANKDAFEKEQVQDLSSILTTEEQVELTLLIANITELMRKQIEDAFDASITNAKKPQQALHNANKNPNVSEHVSHEETEEEEKARKLRDKREKELSAPKMLELKKDSLEFFDKWRDSVILRVGKVVNNPKELTDEQKQKASVEVTPYSEPLVEPKVISRLFQYF